MLPAPIWPLAEHAEFGQNCFDASIGSVWFCILDSMPVDACFCKSSFPFHRLVELYLKWGMQKKKRKQYTADFKAKVGKRDAQGRKDSRAVGIGRRSWGKGTRHFQVHNTHVCILRRS